ncbi:hypothetical protein NDA13_001716 [Ustilago tritici]|nr:hypothetical protein NDA13_001716 [Ustilago tritici]
MSSLQRQPVLFVHHAADAYPEATSQNVSVSQYIEPGQAGKSGGGFWSKLFGGGGMFGAAHQGKVRVMDARSKNHEKVIKDIERWLIKEGYEG